MKTTEMPLSSCLVCNALFEVASCISKKEAVPEPGSFTICYACGNIMQWDDNMKLVPARLDEIPQEIRMPMKIASKACSDRYFSENGFRISTMYEDL